MMVMAMAMTLIMTMLLVVLLLRCGHETEEDASTAVRLLPCTTGLVSATKPRGKKTFAAYTKYNSTVRLESAAAQEGTVSHRKVHRLPRSFRGTFADLSPTEPKIRLGSCAQQDRKLQNLLQAAFFCMFVAAILRPRCPLTNFAHSTRTAGKHPWFISNKPPLHTTCARKKTTTT